MLDELLELILEDARDHMNKTVAHFNLELSAIRAGRASPAMLKNVRVNYYGSLTPLNQMATVSAPQPDLVMVTPWDGSALKSVERAIMAGNLGLNPSNDGIVIRIPIPPLSEERRRSLVKSARRLTEEAKVAVRNIRRNAKDEVKSTQMLEKLPEDMRYLAEGRLQEATNAFVKKIGSILARKEAEIMEI